MGALLSSRFLLLRLVFFITQDSSADLIPVAWMMDASLLTPQIDPVTPLPGVADTRCHLEAGRISGKVAVTVSPSSGRARSGSADRL
ncbi:hypothetical protein ACFFLM_22805 [Deinococcus oregonensis]|uniref:Secreted protein n=1 Tax=Deinococcus oregonensis TaxID=1805970 RepID=A0ABV6B4V3_9DEIO